MLHGQTSQSLTPTTSTTSQPSRSQSLSSSPSLSPGKSIHYTFLAYWFNHLNISSRFYSPLTPILLPSSGIVRQGKGHQQYSSSNSILGSGQNHPALRGSQQLYQHHQYANYNNNNNNSSGRLSANGSQSPYTTSSSPGINHNGGGNYLQQQQTENYSGQQTSRGYLASSSSGRNQQQPQQTLTPTSRRDNLSHLDNSRSYPSIAITHFAGNKSLLGNADHEHPDDSNAWCRWSSSLTAKQHNSTPVLGRSAPVSLSQLVHLAHNFLFH